MNSMKYLAAAMAATALLAACDGNKRNNARQDIKQQMENQAVSDRHTAENSLDYLGVYEGTLPAASSPGIKTTLTLNADKSFTLRSEYIGEKEGIFNDKGTYTVAGNILTIHDGDDTTYYKVEENRLRMLDKDKQPVTGELADRYILTRVRNH